MRKPNRFEASGVAVGLLISGLAAGGLAKNIAEAKASDGYKEKARGQLNALFGAEATKLADKAFLASLLQEAKGIVETQKNGERTVRIYRQVIEGDGIHMLRADMPVGDDGNAQPEEATHVTIAETSDITQKPAVRYDLIKQAGTNWVARITKGNSKPVEITPRSANGPVNYNSTVQAANGAIAGIKDEEKILFPK